MWQCSVHTILSPHTHTHIHTHTHTCTHTHTHTHTPVHPSLPYPRHSLSSPPNAHTHGSKAGRRALSRKFPFSRPHPLSLPSFFLSSPPFPILIKGLTLLDYGLTQVLARLSRSLILYDPMKIRDNFFLSLSPSPLFLFPLSLSLFPPIPLVSLFIVSSFPLRYLAAGSCVQLSIIRLVLINPLTAMNCSGKLLKNDLLAFVLIKDKVKTVSINIHTLHIFTPI